MAGPPIPEDEDVTTPQSSWVEAQPRWAVPSLDLPQRPLSEEGRGVFARRAWADMDSSSEVSYEKAHSSCNHRL